MSTSPYLQACPSCGRLVPFAHTGTTVAVCTCTTVLRLKEDATIVTVPYAVVQGPNDVIDVGTTGVWQEQNFTVLGRFRLWLPEAVVNYWTIVMDDSRLQYLVEGYGLYAIFETQKPDNSLLSVDLNTLATGRSRELAGGTPYLLERKETCYRWEAEGELLLPECRNSFTILDFSSADGQHLELIRFSENHLVHYKVVYTSFSSLQLTKLRPGTGSVTEIPCTRCGQTIQLTAYPFSQSCTCLNCNARYVLKPDGNYKMIEGYNKLDVRPDIRLGISGMVKNIQYTVTGFAVKQENVAEHSQWREYTLYHPQEGFAFLSEYAGHWIYTRQQGDTPVLFTDTVTELTFRREPFKLFNCYHFEVVQAAGEFPNNLFNDREKQVHEFISPPEMWIREKSGGEGIEWFWGEHISNAALEKAFGNQAQLPYKSGVGAIQPLGYIYPGKIFLVSLMAMCTLIVVHLLTIATHRQQVLLERNFSFADSAASFSTVAGPVKLDKRSSNVQVDIAAPVNNSWFELDLALVNRQTGEEFSMNEGVEYYSGVSEGESWSEGSNSETGYITRLPAGEYNIQITGSRDLSNAAFMWVTTFNITLTYDVPDHRNLFACIVLLLLWPVISYMYINYNEKRRWENSPFAPVSNEN